MRKTLLLSTALGAGLLLGAPAFAQSGMSSSGMSSSGMSSHASQPSVAPLPAQQRAAGHAGAMSHQRDSVSLLRQSEQAVNAGNWARANELLERAQTSALNSQATAGGAPMGGSAGIRGFDDAHRALMSRNRSEAQRALRMAMSDAERADMNTGAGTGAMPMQGGGYGGMGSSMGSGMGTDSMGTGTMRDQGMGDRSMSRADLIILAQGGGGGGSSGGTGGLSGSTPGSPGAGTGSGSSPNPSVTAPPTSGSNPPVGSAMPPAARSGANVGAPAPGATSVTPTPGVGTPRATTPGAGGTTGGQNR
ncbi:hypothetical protein [Siccirubricoccus sp. G192]|uniref:hypothetical protein n=1 Tax=Siccirubricoccus sp. G192 TaxID=2849651 RepID=UPI001C2C1921|nr:hypothetical protein [Siccirubricoccus sp. G192]MBV1795967.1 hypothetical protein [Siccirubricoccus sp. G192]